MLMVDAQVARGAEPARRFTSPAGARRAHQRRETHAAARHHRLAGGRAGRIRPGRTMCASRTLLLETVLDAMPSVRAIVADRGYRGLDALCTGVAAYSSTSR